MKKIIISVAPIAADAASVEPSAVAGEIIRAAQAGAAMVHLHAKGRDGKLTADISVLKEIVEAVRRESDIIIETSTGGVSGLTIEERCAPLDYARVETASLNCGSCNLGEAVYKNSFEDIRYCSRGIINKGILPDFEMFEIGMINNILTLGDGIKFGGPMLFNIVLGLKGVMPATIEALAAFKQFIPSGSLWGITHYDRRDFLLLQAALSMGASLVRVGFEDSIYLEKSLPAPDNVSQVKRIAEILGDMGMQPASPAQARQTLGLKAPRN